MLLPVLPENMPRSDNRFWGFIGRLVFRIKGWHIEGDVPNLKKVVLIGAPHTSNWDFVLGMATILALKIKVTWLGKDSIFKGPAGTLFRSWGGMPVERSDTHDMVSQVAAEFTQRDKMWLALAPEGTRGHVDQWKSGFWHIAKAAGVPIQAIVFDYQERKLIIGKAFIPGDDLQADMKIIRAYYAEVGNGKYPQGE